MTHNICPYPSFHINRQPKDRSFFTLIGVLAIILLGVIVFSSVMSQVDPAPFALDALAIVIALIVSCSCLLWVIFIKGLDQRAWDEQDHAYRIYLGSLPITKLKAAIDDSSLDGVSRSFVCSEIGRRETFGCAD